MWDLFESVPDHCLSFYFVLGSGGNGNPNLHIPFFLQVLKCLCVCKLTKLAVSSSSTLHVRYLLTN